MGFQRRVDKARENMHRAENMLKCYVVNGPNDLAEYLRLSEATRLARNEFLNQLDLPPSVFSRPFMQSSKSDAMDSTPYRIPRFPIHTPPESAGRVEVGAVCLPHNKTNHG